MIKESIISLLFIAAAATAFAAEDRFDVASVDKNNHPGIQNRVVAPVVTEKYEYYEIRGNSEKELRGQMCRNGCAFNDGEKYDSVTTWRWKLNYGHDRAPGVCTADSFKVALEISYRYPKWVRTSDAPQPLVDKWDGYMKNLITHENGHRDLAVEAAAELSHDLAALPPAASCAELDREIGALSRERREKLNADQKSYDETTVHGKTQGVVFP
jgi:predicted secreted Zn-dependent protease